MRPRLLDHVGLVATELEALREAWRCLGFAPTEPRALLGRDASGEVVPLGQRSCHAVFDGGYVELTAVAPNVPRHHLDPWRWRGAGAWIVAFGTADAAAAQARCAHAGLGVTPVMHASRAIDYGSRHGEARFRWFMVEAAQSPEALLCGVEHRTPELVFQPEVAAHPNGVTALAGLVIVVREPAAVAGRYERLLGVAPAGIAGGLRLALDTEHVDLVTPAAYAERYPGAVPPAEPRPAAVRLSVANRDLLRAALARSGLPVTHSAAGTWVDAPHAGGVLVEFEE